MEKNLLADIERVEALYAAQIEKRDELQASLDTRQYTEDNIARAFQFREDFAEGLEHATPDDIRRALAIMKVEVTVKDAQAFVKCIVPGEPTSIGLGTCRNIGAPWLPRSR